MESGVVVGDFRATYFASEVYDSVMETEKRELWDQLSNESERAHQAIQTFLSLPSNDRTIIEAYRRHVGNTQAPKPSDTWAKWSRDFAWAERASAYDAYLESLRREAFERGIEEEAERQGALAERTRTRFDELMTRGYEEAITWFEEVGYEGMRASDVVRIMQLHLEAVKIFGVPENTEEDTWTEQDEIEIDRIIREVEEGDYPEEEDTL
jgi:hypothetical protein